MHARMVTLTFQRDKIDEAIRTIREHIAEIQQRAGYRNFLFFADRATGKAIILALWASEGDLQAVEASGLPQTRIAELAPYLVGQPTREVFEVAVDDLSGIEDAGGAHAARVTSLLFQPNKIDEAIRITRDSIVPVAQQQKGSRGFLSLVDRGAGKGVTCTFWESEADLAATDASGYYQSQVAKVQPLTAGQPTREVYELTLPALPSAPTEQPHPHAPTP